MEKVNINLYKGQTYQRILSISGFTSEITQLYMTVKENANNKNFVLQKKIGDGITLMDINNEGQNLYTLEISSSDTENLKTDFDYGYDITAKSNDIKIPIVIGTLKISPVYTRKRDET